MLLNSAADGAHRVEQREIADSEAHGRARGPPKIDGRARRGSHETSHRTAAEHEQSDQREGTSYNVSSIRRFQRTKLLQIFIRVISYILLVMKRTFSRHVMSCNVLYIQLCDLLIN